MKAGFRQSMLVLHSWCGLTAGWLLFFVFLTGTTGFVHAEISRWMRPELPLMSATPATADTLRRAEQYLARHASGADFWSIFFPGHRDHEALTVTWRDPRGEIKRAILDSATGEPIQIKTRETGGGQALYVMHYALHYVSRDAGIFIVGVAAMVMFVSVLTGIVGHRTIVQDALALPVRQGAARWRSVHALLGATALPFFVVMTWSGLLFSLFTYMPVAQTALFRGDDATMQFNVEAYFPPDRPYGERDMEIPPSRTALPEVLAKAEALWGRDSVSHLRIDHPGRDDVRVTAYTPYANARGETRVAFDAATGAPIVLMPPRTATAKFLETMVGLHKGYFAGPYLKALYVACGLAGTALVATGLVHWCMKRKARAQTARARFAVAVVDRINLATVVGFPVGLAAYFWANRLLPLDMVRRGDWEVRTIFMVWVAALLFAAGRRQNRAWLEMCALAAAAYGLIPVLNALTTARHLGVTVPAGDWGLAGVDLSVLAVSIFFALVAWALWRRQRRALTSPCGDAVPETV